MTIDEVDAVYNDITFSDLMGVDDCRTIEVPTLKEVIEFLQKQSLNARLFNCVPIGTAAIVCLECTVDGYTLHANADGEDIDCARGAYEGWDEIYLADSDADLRTCAHRMISFVRDSIDNDQIFCRGIFA